MRQATPDPQRAEHAEDEAVDVEQRQAVDEMIVGGPPPRLGEAVEIRGDRTRRQHRALGQSGGSGRVHDERDVVGHLCARGKTLRQSSTTSVPSTTSEAPEFAMIVFALAGPASGGIGASGTSAAKAATTAATVSSVGVAFHATAWCCRVAAAIASPRSRSSPQDTASPATQIGVRAIAERPRQRWQQLVHAADSRVDSPDSSGGQATVKSAGSGALVRCQYSSSVNGQFWAMRPLRVLVPAVDGAAAPRHLAVLGVDRAR